METTLRQEFDNLVDKITNNATEYNFFQLMHLLEPYEDFIKLQLNPTASLAFPASEIDKCHLNAKNELLIELNFMGLYGVDTPLPHYFLTASKTEIIKSFFNIINLRFYQLFYQAWKKCQLSIDLTQPKSPLLFYLKVLSGLDAESMAYATTIQCSKKGLSSITIANFVRQFFNDVNVHVKQFVPRWMDISTAAFLGVNEFVLGHNAVLGKRILDVTSKIEIIIGPQPYEKFLQCLPGTPMGMQLAKLLRHYLNSRVIFDLIFIVEPPVEVILTLGNNIAIGLNSWLGKQRAQHFLFRVSEIRFC
ncbi:type VI secretion system baseplate subunit TssG [soil metagenome]